MHKIANLLKTNRLAYYIYNYTFSFLLKFIGIFIKIDEKLILFNSFGGNKFDDSPKAIYDYMKKSKKYENYKLIWALNDTSIVENNNVDVVKNNSIKFFIIALKAKYWITNSSMERGLKFKKKQTFYIDTWHGTAIKHIGKDENNLSIDFRVSESDYMLAQSEYDINIFSKCFNYPKEKIHLTGLPRNDELYNVSEIEIEKIKKKLNIATDKKVILYAPTYREYSRDSEGCILTPPIDLKKWKQKLEKKYILLFRAHYEVNKVLGIVENDFIRDCSDYECLNDLLKISDILISDYSSIMIDYSILERPIFNYIYDYNEYNEKRGLYFDIRKKLPGNCIENEEELINKLLSYDYKNEKEKIKKFKNEFIQAQGSASKFIDTIIKESEK
jgi:CDP-glycerol glycerophosphotransferase